MRVKAALAFALLGSAATTVFFFTAAVATGAVRSPHHRLELQLQMLFRYNKAEDDDGDDDGDDELLQQQQKAGIPSTAKTLAAAASVAAASVAAPAADGNGNQMYSYDHYDYDDVPPEDAFGACIILKDDNHWFVEWLAYHWFALPLRHLVAYVDPRSRTSPRGILERWQDKMTIQVWNQTYASRINSHYVRNVQNSFLHDCLRHYKQQHDEEEGKKVPSWIVLIDSDEFLAVNDLARRSEGADIYRRGLKVPPNDRPASVMKFLRLHQRLLLEEQQKRDKQQQEEDGATTVSQLEAHPHCLPLLRLQICYDEEYNATATSSSSNNNNLMGGPLSDHGIVPSDLLTHNFQWGDSERTRKMMVNVGAIPRSAFDALPDPAEADSSPQGIVVHNPVPSHCPELSRRQQWLGKWTRKKALKKARLTTASANETTTMTTTTTAGIRRRLTSSSSVTPSRGMALFTVYHYPGTLAQRSFRMDIRGSYLSRKGTAPPPPSCPKVDSASDLKPWLGGFVGAVGGRAEAARLLEGVGRTDYVWPATPFGLHLQRKQQQQQQHEELVD